MSTNSKRLNFAPGEMCKQNVICRVCEVTDDLQDLFSEQNENLLRMLKAVANIHVKKDDFLPNYICIACISQLRHAHAFKTLCEVTDRKLRDEYFIKPKNLRKGNFYSENGLLNESNGIAENEPSFDDNNKTKDCFIKQVDIEIMVTSKAQELSENGLSRTFESDPLEQEKNNGEYSNTGPEEKQPSSLVYNKIPPKRSLKSTSNTKNSCRICLKLFPSRTKLHLHLKLHGAKPYSCTICSREFVRQESFHRHLAIHSGELIKEFPCEQCKQKFAASDTLQRHIRKFHEKERDYVCELCGKRFVRLHHVRQHHISHIEEKNYDCTTCGKKFNTDKKLLRHKRLHDPDWLRTRQQQKAEQASSKKSFDCGTCGKSYSSKIALETHIRTHTGEKPFLCPVGSCGRRFTGYVALYLHKRIHTDIRPYCCRVCGLTFRQQTHLNRHARLHSDNVKPCMCDVCGKSMSCSESLVVHKRLHSGEQPYQCAICDRRFADRTNWRRHEAKHSQDDSKFEREKLPKIRRPRKKKSKDAKNIECIEENIDVRKRIDIRED